MTDLVILVFHSYSIKVFHSYFIKFTDSYTLSKCFYNKIIALLPTMSDLKFNIEIFLSFNLTNVKLTNNHMYRRTAHTRY
jgi:hypothetical protein